MLVHLFHQLVMIPTALGEHLCPDRVDFGNDRVFV
jgi:hypothetical protein